MGFILVRWGLYWKLLASPYVFPKCFRSWLKQKIGDLSRFSTRGDEYEDYSIMRRDTVCLTMRLFLTMSPTAEIKWRRWNVNEYVVLVEWRWQKAVEVLGEKPVPVRNPTSTDESGPPWWLVAIRLSDGSTLDVTQSGRELPMFRSNAVFPCSGMKEVRDYGLVGYTVYSCSLKTSLFRTSRLHLHNWRIRSRLTLKLFGSDLRTWVENKVVKNDAEKKTDSTDLTKRNCGKWKSHKRRHVPSKRLYPH
jgi:hypothetical protein